MSGTRYTEEFKMAAVRQVVDKGYPVLEVSARLGVTNRTLYAWLRKYDMPIPSITKHDSNESAKDAEIKRLQDELRRTREERDILKKAAVYFANHHE